MGILENLSTGEKVFLKSLHIFGRNREKSDTELKSKDISHIHASIRWTGWEWMVTDLSRNGVWIDGVRLAHGKNAELKMGHIIRFGSSDESVWKMSDQNPPVNLLIPLTSGAPAIELGRLNALPDDTTPDISVYLSHTGQWVYENENGVTPLNSGDIIHHARGSWQFVCAEPVDLTFSKEESREIRFVFKVSMDEEHVNVILQLGEDVFDLGERAHHYMLLTLARQRLEDAREGLDLATQGWLDQDRMAAMLNLESSHLNIHIFRIRKQLQTALPEALSLPRLVERRPGGLRFGYPDFQIFRGATLEGTLAEGRMA